MSSPSTRGFGVASPGRAQSSGGGSGSSNNASEEARLEHIATECIAKAVHIVLAGRVSERGVAGARGGRDSAARNRWFNLETEEVESAVSSLDIWKRDTSLTLVAEIYGEKASGGKDARLLEAWTFQIRRAGFGGGSALVGSGSVGDFNSSSGSSAMSSSGSGSCASQQQASSSRGTRVNSQRHDTPLVYKRAVIFLRSLFCFVRLLPAFSVHQVTKRSSQSKLLITSRIRVGAGQSGPEDVFAGEDVALREFKQIDTPVGSICAQVVYVKDPVGVLSKEYGNSVMYTSRMANKAKAEGGMAGGRPAGAARAGGMTDAMAIAQGGQGAGREAANANNEFAPHSAPQVIRRQSWSFSRNQMQQEAASHRNKFSDVMVIDPVNEEECGGKGTQQQQQQQQQQRQRPRQNTMPMLIPNNRSSGGRATRESVSGSGSMSGPGSGSAANRAGNLSTQLRVKMSQSKSPSPSPGNTLEMKAFTAPGRSSSLATRVYRTVSASPDECVVGFAMRQDNNNGGRDSSFANRSSVSPPTSHIAKMELPISALNQRRLESSAGQSLVKTPVGSASASANAGGNTNTNSGSNRWSGEGSDMGSGYRMMPLSVSPQLPFAMTPKFSASASSLSYDFQASPMDSANGIPSIRLVRRATTPGNSSGMASFNSSSYSPGQDHFLDGGMPYPPLCYGSYNNKPRLTFPSSNSGTYEEDDQDALPFALETLNSPGDSPGMESGSSQDAAIGAFVRTLQDAPPLRNDAAASDTMTCRTLSSAMLELKQLRETLDTVRLVSN